MNFIQFFSKNPNISINNRLKNFLKQDNTSIQKGKLSTSILPKNEYSFFNSKMLDEMEEIQESQDRFNAILMSNKQIEADPRLKEGIQAISLESNAVDNEGHPYLINLDLDGNPTRQIKKIFEGVLKLNKDLSMETKAVEITNKMLSDGDCFAEVVVNLDKKEIIDLRILEGPKDGFLIKKLLHEKTLEHIGWDICDYRTGSIVRRLAEWQIRQFSIMKDGDYSKPLLSSAHLSIVRLKNSETSMHVAREDRSFVRFNHVIIGATPEKLKKMRIADEMREKMTGRKGIAKTFYSNHEMQMFDPKNEQLQNIEDVKYFQAQMFDALKRPEALYGGRGSGVDRATLDKQFDIYIIFLNYINMIISNEYKQIFNLFIRSKGETPDNVPIQINWVEKKSADFLTTVQALSIARRDGYLSKITCTEELGFDPMLEIERMNLEKDLYPEIEINQDSNSDLGTGYQKNKDANNIKSNNKKFDTNSIQESLEAINKKYRNKRKRILYLGHKNTNNSK